MVQMLLFSTRPCVAGEARALVFGRRDGDDPASAYLLLSGNWASCSSGAMDYPCLHFPVSLAVTHRAKLTLHLRQLFSMENSLFVCINQGSLRNKTNRILSQASMEAEKSYDLPSASQRTRKASDITQSQSKGLRARGRCLNAGKMDVPAQAGSKFVLPPFFVVVRPSTDWMMQACIGEGNLCSAH